MDFKQIEVFINVAKHKSFSRAANAVFLSQPAVSSHISILEKELNVQLFDRTSKEVLLTPAGESFLRYAIEIINTRNTAISCLESFNKNVTGTLNLAASTTPCNTIVPVLMKKFSEKYPAVTFKITEQNSGDIIDNIIKFNNEIGIIGSCVNDEKIKAYRLMNDELVLISPVSFGIQDDISIKNLLKYKFILREKHSATRTTFESALNQNNISLNDLSVSCEVNNLDSLFQFVKCGVGVSIVSRAVFNNYSDCNKIKCSNIIELPLSRGIYLVTSSRRTLTPTAKAFFDLCKDLYKF